jgi:hypothetical protein
MQCWDGARHLHHCLQLLLHLHLPESDEDLHFDDDDDERYPEFAALNMEFTADEEREVAEEAEAEEDDDNDLYFDDDGPDPEEKAVEKRAILTSYESLKKAKADACAREEAKEEQLCHTLYVSIQQAPTEEAGCRYSSASWRNAELFLRESEGSGSA